MSTDTVEEFDLDVEYAGQAGPLFGLAIKTMLLTFVTLGIYRFWMKTRLRRYYWSSIKPGGVPLEYTGTGLEKLLGFLIAVVFLAIYLAIVNLGLSFVGLAFFQGNPFALNISFLAVIPLIFYARYRARRYILSRTRWRGLRFGAEKAAWTYTLHAIGHSVLTAITLGLLWPRQTFKLEKFVTDRTWYGDMQLRQEGRWTMLLRPWLVALAVTAVVVVAFTALAAQENLMALWVLVAGFVILPVAYVYYSVESFRLMTANKRAGNGVGFSSSIRTGTVLKIYILGAIAIALATFVFLFVIGGISVTFVAGSGMTGLDFERMLEGDMAVMNAVVPIPFIVALYFLMILMSGALAHVFVIQPVLRHYAQELLVLDAAEIETVNQRAHDENVDADGFADALDVGAAI